VSLVIVPEALSKKLDEYIASFRKQFPDATDEDAQDVRSQLLGVVRQYGYVPEFEIERNEADGECELPGGVPHGPTESM